MTLDQVMFGHDNCHNGHIYKQAGIVLVAFTSNSAQKVVQTLGEIDSSTVYITLPRYYDDDPTKEIYVSTYDKFALLDQDTVIAEEQLVNASRTGSDKLNYPPIKIEYVIDAHGVEYSSGDFNIQNGRIVWTGNRPGVDPKTGLGTVYAVRYLYHPFWIVKNLAKDIRISRADGSDGRVLKKMPISLVAQREYAYNQEVNNKDNQDGYRVVPSPKNGSFGGK